MCSNLLHSIPTFKKNHEVTDHQLHQLQNLKFKILLIK